MILLMKTLLLLTTATLSFFNEDDADADHRRRLVINIGGQKFGSQILGGKHLGKICLQTTF